MKIRNATVQLDQQFFRNSESHSFKEQLIEIEFQENSIHVGAKGSIDEVENPSKVFWEDGEKHQSKLDGAQIHIFDEKNDCVLSGHVSFQFGPRIDQDGNIEFDVYK